MSGERIFDKRANEGGRAAPRTPDTQENVHDFPREDAARVLQPGPQYWLTHSPDVAAMPAHRLRDEANEIDEFLGRQTQSSATTLRLEQVRDSLRQAQEARRQDAARAPARKARGTRPPGAAQADASAARMLREHSSAGVTDPATHEVRPEALFHEYDELEAAARRKDLPEADREALQVELANLEPAMKAALERRSAERYADAVDRALAPDESIRDERESLAEVVRRIDSIRPVPGKPGTSSLAHGHERIEMSDETVEAIRGQAFDTLDRIAAGAYGANHELLRDYESFVDLTFEDHPVVGAISMTRSGENPLDWRDDLLGFAATSNSAWGEYRKLRAQAKDPWGSDRTPLGPLAEKVLVADRISEAGNTWYDYHKGQVLEGTAGAVGYLGQLKTAGKYASYTFSPGWAALYAGAGSVLEQASEVHYGQRDRIDYRGVALDMTANFIGAKLGGMIPGAREGAGWIQRAGLWALRDRTTAAATTATRMGMADVFEHGNYSAGEIAGAAGHELTDVKGMIVDAAIHHGSGAIHAYDARQRARAAQEGETGTTPSSPPSQASATVLTQRPKDVKPLELPVHEIDNPHKGKGTLTEATVPFELYRGWEWNHIAGGAETASSRTSIARTTEYGDTGGNDFLVEHTQTDRLVIGEQKAVDNDSFSDASAISTMLVENVRNTRQKLQESLDARRDTMSAEDVTREERRIGRLDATEKALENATPLPDGVVFEFTNVGGKGKAIGKEHVERLEKAFHDKPGYFEHLLERTFVRDPKLARAKGRDPEGKRGTDSDPDIVPAKELLTPQAQDTVERLRAGKTEKQWASQKARETARTEKAERDAGVARRKAASQERKADEREAWRGAKDEGERVRRETLQALREQQRGKPKPRTQRERERENSRMKREAADAGREARDRSFDDFKAQRKAKESQAASQRKADQQAQREAREKQRALDAQERERLASEQKKARETAQGVRDMSPEDWKQLPPARRKELEQQARTDKPLAAAMAQKEGSLETPASVRRMNDEARAKHEAETREAAMGKAAHYANTAAAGLRALDKFHDERDNGKSYATAGYEAGKTYLENTNPVVGAVGIARSRMEKDASGTQYYGDDAVDAWLGTIGETAAGYIVPGGGVDQLVNAGANLSGAVDDHMKRGADPNDPALRKANLRTATDLAADVTPSRMFSQVLGGGARSYYDIARAATGDTRGVDKFADDAVHGKLGSVIQPWAMAADFMGNLATDDAGTALEKTVRKTEGTTLKKLGDASGDAMYDLGQSQEAKSGKYGTSVQGISMMLGVTSDLIAGQSFEKALEKAADAGKGSLADKVGSALGDAAFETVDRAKRLMDDDMPAAREKLAQWWKGF